MSRHRAFFLCAFPALSTVLLASDEKTPAAPADTNAAETASEHGVPALFSWADVDGDGRLDLVAVSGEGKLQLLSNAGESRFEDVTERAGLAGVTNAALALWADYDGDGRLDLFVGAREGASRLFHNEGGVFIDMSAGSGMQSEGAVQSAHWLDHDGDGRLDLHVVTAAKNELFRGLEGGFFQRAELPLLGAGAGMAISGATRVDGAGEDTDRSFSASGSNETSAGELPRAPKTVGVRLDDLNLPGGRIPLDPSTGSVNPLQFALSCANSIRNQANIGSCLRASSTPTLGMLHPISANLFVAASGNVGIGTTSPAAKLHVAGKARVTDTLTLTHFDRALDITTISGSIYKAGAIFAHTNGLEANTALGRYALSSVTIGYYDTAVGESALRLNTGGIHNSASGANALRYNTYGSHNTANGSRALVFNTTGESNTACGSYALWRNIGSSNTALGSGALANNLTGNGNIAVGAGAGLFLSTGNDNIAIGNRGVGGESATIRLGTAGTHTRAFIAGIRGVTTGNANAIPVLVDSVGQLGTVSSSRRFKEEIRDMGDLTERLLELRPVVFRYKPEVQQGERPLEYGLIAEEVAEVFPDLVVYDEEGQPFTVKYHVLSSMLVNELKKERARSEAQDSAHDRELVALRNRLAALESQVSGGMPPETIAIR